MIPFPIRPKGLRHRSVRMLDRTLADVSVLPMFDANGRVQRLLVVMHANSAVTMLDWRPGLIRVPWLGAMRLDRSGDTLRPLSTIQVSAVRDLWLFDNEKILGTSPFARDEACIALQETNCAGRLTSSAQSVYFRRDLSRISLVSVAQAGGVQLGGWKPKFLPVQKELMSPSIRPAASGSGKRRWILDPIWQR